ncbi:TetR/AcrR family transcriptional regulator [Nonomuraea sp. NPDC049784]|uniref:TetR/AcrR family transcriptional regulator n=1 Tax=Nonomuraea sp. NPDC049784 TaxID=3154361 RepID=UPI00340ED3A7
MGRAYAGKSAEQRERERRERLIAIGYGVFADKGFTNVSIARLCTRAKISLRVFYRSFKTKEDLLTAVISRCLDDAVTAVVRRLEATSDEACALADAAVRAYVEHVTSDRRIYRLLHVEMRHLAGRQAWADPLVMILKGTLRDRLEWRETELRLMMAALAGMVPALLGEWERDDAISVEQVVKTAGRLCSVILSSVEAIQIPARAVVGCPQAGPRAGIEPCQRGDSPECRSVDEGRMN